MSGCDSGFLLGPLMESLSESHTLVCRLKWVTETGLLKISLQFFHTDHQSHFSTWGSQGNVQLGGRHGPRDQHASSLLPDPQQRGWLSLNPGRRAPRLWDHQELHAAGSSSECRCCTIGGLHHGLYQCHRFVCLFVCLFYCFTEIVLMIYYFW